MHENVPIAIAAPAEGESVSVEVQGQAVLVCRSQGRLYAVSDRCTHAGSRLSGGKICDGVISCPLHGAKFRLETGACVFQRLNYAPLQTFQVREIDGSVVLDSPQ